VARQSLENEEKSILTLVPSGLLHGRICAIVSPKTGQDACAAQWFAEVLKIASTPKSQEG
jgi:hypothetical protein